MSLDARERSSCTSNYCDPAFPHLKLHKKRSGAKTTCLEVQSWRTVLSPLIFHFKHWIKVLGLDICYSSAYISQTRDQQRLQWSGSWLAWTNGAAAHYVAIHCSRKRTFGPMVQLADTPSTQSATLGLQPVAVVTTHFPSRWG